MRVEVQLKKTSQAIVYEEAENAYTKGPFYCVLFKKDGERETHKYPIGDIFRCCEGYGASKREDSPEYVDNEEEDLSISFSNE